MSEPRPELRVVLEVFRDLAPANIARGLLLARGIDATLQGDQLIGIAWHLSNAVGGVKLLVRAEDEAAARKLLADSLAEHAGEADDPADEDRSTVVDFAAWRAGAEGQRAGKPAAADEREGRASKVVDLDRGRDAGPEPTAADKLVESAWRASLLGLFLLPPLGQLWSSYLLRAARLAGGARTERGRTLATRAFVANAIVLVLAAMAAARWLGEHS